MSACKAKELGTCGDAHEDCDATCHGCGPECSHPGHYRHVEPKLDPEAEARLAFVGGLYAKAETRHLKRIDAAVILAATLAEMLGPTITALEAEAAKVEPGSICRFNADLMVEMARELRLEALTEVKQAMLHSRLVVVPR